MKIIAVDLDGVLIDSKENPFNNNVNMVNKLFENRNIFIIIYTARSKEIRKETELILANIKVKYHALVMEKMRADYYIDDKNINLDTI